MPHITFEGNSSAYAFGFMYSLPPEPPGSYTHPNGYAGDAYQPQGHVVYSSVVIRGSGGGNQNNDNEYYGRGSTTTKTNVPVSGAKIYTPTTASGGRISQYDLSEGSPAAYYGSGGIGGTANMSNAYNGKDGGGVSVATWPGGKMIAAGGGGMSYNTSRTGRRGMYEGQSDRAGGNYAFNTATGDGAPGRGANTNGGGVCYYGGGGGGGGYSRGGNGGQNNSAGRAGGNGAAPDAANGTGSFGYDSITVDDNTGTTYSATVSWG